MRVLVLADTHLRGGIGRLPAAVHQALSSCEAILHAGDLVDDAVLEALSALAPVHAVLGNNDRDLIGALPEKLEIKLEGVLVGMVHDSGARSGRAVRLSRLFPEAQLVVYGHSHIPANEPGADGQLLFNPGSPTQRRRMPTATFGELVLEYGQIRSHQIIAV